MDKSKWGPKQYSQHCFKVQKVTYDKQKKGSITIMSSNLLETFFSCEVIVHILKILQWNKIYISSSLNYIYFYD